MYQVADGYFLIPTSEVPVTNLHRGQILDEDALPLRYCAFTPCFRREAGSYGKDVRGLNRLHQFDKVEMVVFARPEDSYDALEAMTAIAERMLVDLGLAYRRLLMCTGDMGFTQAKKYDLEVWSPGQDRWLEVSSVSNMEAFQAARLEARCRPGGAPGQGKTRLVHTLNGSALAFPRTLAALIETHQTADGEVALPAVLQRYLGRPQLG
jgi:seryl-tRNA synthetase